MIHTVRIAEARRAGLVFGLDVEGERSESAAAAHQAAPPKTSRSDRQRPTVRRYLVDERGLSPVHLAYCRDLQSFSGRGSRAMKPVKHSACQR